MRRLFRRGGNGVTIVRDLAAATAIAQEALARSDEAREYAIYADRTQEHDFGWVFFFNSKAYVETGDTRHQVPGCGPLVVLRENGETRELGTAGAPSALIAAFARKWRQQHS